MEHKIGEYTLDEELERAAIAFRKERERNFSGCRVFVKRKEETEK